MTTLVTGTMKERRVATAGPEELTFSEWTVPVACSAPSPAQDVTN